MTQQTFKVGDRVRVKDTSSLEAGSIGRIVEVTDGEIFNRNHCVIFGGDRKFLYRASDLKLLPKTLDNLVEGDVVVDKDDTDDTMTVAHVLKPGLYVIADDEEEPQLYTATKLKYLDYVPQQDPEDDKTCLTVADVAKKLGLNPDKLHIVADKKAA